MAVDEDEIVHQAAGVPVGAGVAGVAGAVGLEGLGVVVVVVGAGEVGVVGALLLQVREDGGGFLDGVQLLAADFAGEGEVALLGVVGGGAEIDVLVADVLEEESRLGVEVIGGAGDESAGS